MKVLKIHCMIGLVILPILFAGCSKRESSAAASQGQALDAAPSQQMASGAEAAAAPEVHYKDGVYTALSEMKDDWGGSGEITITIAGGKITACDFVSYDKDGKIKGEDYGKTNGVIKNAGLYKIAQSALAGAAQYGQKLVETQQLEMVDAIAGATVSHELFQNVAGIALGQAKAAN